MLPKLYGKDKKDGIKVWWVTVEGDTITVHHGKDGGKIQTQPTVCKAKNVGRANETTPEQQALSEAQSKWNKQVKKGYCEDKDNILGNTLPLLAEKYQDAGHRLGWPLDGLVKLNGVRCTCFLVKGEVFFQSRGGESYPPIARIADELKEKVFDEYPNIYIDCELYCHGMFLEDITGAVKKHNENTERLKAYIFDIYNPEKPDQVWTERYAFYNELEDSITPLDNIGFVTAIRLESEEEMIQFHDEVVAEGYEGLVLRSLDGIFRFDTRCSDFQKYKIPLSEEFLITDIVVDKNGGGIPVCVVYTDAGDKTFKAPFKATHEKRKHLAQNPREYIGRWITVDFESYSKYGVPTKPIGIAFRDMDGEGKPLV